MNVTKLVEQAINVSKDSNNFVVFPTSMQDKKFCCGFQLFYTQNSLLVPPGGVNQKAPV